MRNPQRIESFIQKLIEDDKMEELFDKYFKQKEGW